MKNVYIWLAGIVGGAVVLGLVYLLGDTRGAARERDNCARAQLEVVRAAETSRQKAGAVVDSADDRAIRRMLCDDARGGCKRPDSASD